MKSLRKITILLLLLAGAIAMFAKANDSPDGTDNILSCTFDSDTVWVCLGESYDIQVNSSGGTGQFSYVWTEGSKPSGPATSQSFYTFTPTAVGFDTLHVTVTDQASEQCSSSLILATLGDCVWPGDANGNGIANHVDLLNIGRGMGLVGPPRPDAHTNWVGQASHSWGQVAPDGADYTHSDADGDGTIHLLDIQAIHNNYTFTPATTQPSSGSGPAFFLEFSDSTVSAGDTLAIDIMLGDVQNPADSLYGLAFSLTFDDWLIDSGTVQLDLSTSWLGTNGTDLTGFARDFSRAGQIDIAITRLNQLEQNGYGRVAGIIVVIEDIVGKKEVVVANNIELGGVHVEAFDGRQRQVRIRNVSPSVGIEESLAQDLDFSIFPNPAISSFTIDVPGTVIEKVELFSIEGKRLFDFLPENRSEKARITVPQSIKGYCFLKIQTSEGLINKSILITN
jgi:hypothetical protein